MSWPCADGHDDNADGEEEIWYARRNGHVRASDDIDENECYRRGGNGEAPSENGLLLNRERADEEQHRDCHE